MQFARPLLLFLVFLASVESRREPFNTAAFRSRHPPVRNDFAGSQLSRNADALAWVELKKSIGNLTGSLVDLILGDGEGHKHQSSETSSSSSSSSSSPYLNISVPDIMKVNEAHGSLPYLFAGDLILTEGQRTLVADHLRRPKRNRTKRQILVQSSQPWSNNVVYYEISATAKFNPQAITAIQSAISYWQSVSCVKFVQSTTKIPRVQFINDTGCYSMVGRVSAPQPQPLSIGTGCEYFGIVSHEIGHALGLIHTFTRPDRNYSVAVNSSNIASGMAYNFAQYSPAQVQTFGVPYEYGSVMHYSSNGFASNANFDTMTANSTLFQNTMGNRVSPTVYDTFAVNSRYSCYSCPSSAPVCYNGGVRNPANCSTCVCPYGLSGAQCDQIAPSATCSATTQGQTQFLATAQPQSFYATVGDGTYNYNMKPSACNFLVVNPSLGNISLTIGQVGEVCTAGCFYGGVEVKAALDMRAVGYRFCCSNQQGLTIVSQSYYAIVYMFNFLYATSVNITYQACGGSNPHC